MSIPRFRCLRVAAASSLIASALLLLASPAGAEPGFAQVQAMPKPFGTSTISGYNAVSCPSATECTAVGPYDSSDLPTAVTETSGSWGAPTELTPPLGAIASGKPPVLSSVSCPASGTCVAVGIYALSSGAELPMLFTETSGTWSPVGALPTPANVESGAGEAFAPTAVDCPSAGNCVVVGEYRGDDGLTHNFADTQTSGGAFSAVQLPDVAGNSSTTIVGVSSLSCTDTSDCTAVGEWFDESTFNIGTATWTESSGTWSTPTEVPTTGGGFTFFIAASLACPDATTCIAVGSEIGISSSGFYDLAAYAVETSGVWSTAVPMRVAYLYPLAVESELNGISCDTAAVCEAVGSFDASTGVVASGAATWSNGKWSSFGYAHVRVKGKSSTDAALLAVSCASTTQCTSVGIWGDSTRKHPSHAVYAFSVNLVPVRAVTKPGAPVAVTGYGISGGVQAEWEPPVDDGGAPVQSFTAKAEPGGATCTTAGVTCALRGLRNGDHYRVIVIDRTSYGRSPATVGPPVMAGAAPTEPRGVKVALRENRLVITWRPSGSPRDEPVHYTVRVVGPRHFAGVVRTRGPRASILVVTTGTYKITVTATNESGTSKAAKAKFTPVVDLPPVVSTTEAMTAAKSSGGRSTIGVAALVESLVEHDSIWMRDPRLW
jgi:hypothetical protein